LASYAQFDYYLGDAIQTPLTNGTSLSFKIIAANTVGEGPASTIITFGDLTAPVGNGAPTQSGTADNSAGTSAKVITVSFKVNEYLGSTPTPSFNFNEAGGDVAYALPANAAAFTAADWDADMKGGTVTITIPANKNGAGDQLNISGFKDNSGNSVSQSILYTLQ
jgi:hypothetical protein